MDFTIAERLHLYDMLPKEGNITMVRVISEAQAVLGLSSDELERWSVENEEGTVRWNGELDTTTDIELTTTARSIFAKELKRLDGEGKLSLIHLSLWDKFVSPNGQTQ